MLCLNKELWLAVPSSMTIFKQSECFKSAQKSSFTLKFVNNLSSKAKMKF